jgi:hypothetical protein
LLFIMATFHCCGYLVCCLCVEPVINSEMLLCFLWLLPWQLPIVVDSLLFMFQWQPLFHMSCFVSSGTLLSSILSVDEHMKNGKHPLSLIKLTKMSPSVSFTTFGCSIHLETHHHHH